MEDKKERMIQLVELLNRARRAYEQSDTEIMSNLEYDRLYDELLGTGTRVGDNPCIQSYHSCGI